MDPATFLFDVPPAAMERLCKVVDTGGDSFGWRALAVRILPTLLEVQMLEGVAAAGRSPTRELLWSWAQQNKTVQDLLQVLQDMGHHRALQILQGRPKGPRPMVHEVLLPEKPPEETLTLQAVVEGTRDFHRDMRISEGRFSDVYRGQVGSRTFAVKLFKQNRVASWRKLWDIFRKETEIHRLYQHPNILELLGCFSDESRYCLVYPFLPGGSLSRRLHHRDEEPPLSWQERLSIIKGVAKALHHLHKAQPCPLVCGNVSSANILLDEGQPKLTDFGLARLRPHSTNQSCTISLNAGYHSNLGYLPEEYIRDGKLSFSLDVYSFGMVIMETITGRKVIEDAPKQTQLRDLLTAEVEDSGGVDSCLHFLDESAGRWPAALALRLLALALECASSRQRSRPSMENVLPTLSQLLPPPVCPLADQPRSLHDGGHLDDAPSSTPVEDDEQRSLAAGPCERSQSEVTYLSDVTGADGEAAVDLYSSWPVQCSCPAETSGLPCEDCRANGFTPGDAEDRPDVSVVENEAKLRVRNKLSLYNKGLIDTEELLSETGQQ